MGMSLQDFDLCTPLEFEKIFEKWRLRSDAAMRRSWEQTRQLAVSILQPYAQKPLEPRDVMRFEWDNEPDGESSGTVARPDIKKTAEERAAEKRHYEEVKRARGLT